MKFSSFKNSTWNIDDRIGLEVIGRMGKPAHLMNRIIVASSIIGPTLVVLATVASNGTMIDMMFTYT
jgi:hypothetical protein